MSTEIVITEGGPAIGGSAQTPSEIVVVMNGGPAIGGSATIL